MSKTIKLTILIFLALLLSLATFTDNLSKPDSFAVQSSAIVIILAIGLITAVYLKNKSSKN